MKNPQKNQLQSQKIYRSHEKDTVKKIAVCTIEQSIEPSIGFAAIDKIINEELHLNKLTC